MRARFLYGLTLLFFWQTSQAQLYYPLENYYQGEIERWAFTDSGKVEFYNHHLSSRPILEARTKSDSIYASYDKRYYWITQKLFKENFLIFKGEDFWCAVDPIVDLEVGHDFEVDSIRFKTWNTRGLRVQAKFMDKIGFTTSFYENQAFVLDYQETYFRNHGEFIPSPAFVQYSQQNAVVPGYARTKSFKSTGFDFAFAEGQVSYVPNQFFNLQFGNGSQFIGNGYRSLLLSDFSTNYPFLKLETTLFNGRLQYSARYAVLQNLYRIAYKTTPEATYERKLGTFHYLDFAVTKNLNIGLFEGAVWKRTDSLGTHEPDWLFVNPIIAMNSFIKSDNDNEYNSILGLNISYQLKQNLFYGQLVFDNNTIGAYQIGLKSYNLIVPKLDFQAEYNHANQNTYMASKKRYNYSHYNLPLAHPYGAGFDELIFRISYQYKRFFVENKTIYSARYENDTLNFGTDILQANSTVAIQFYDRSKIFYNQFEIGYRFNKRYNLQAVIGHLYRTNNSTNNPQITNYVYVGVRTRLKNKTLDF